MSSAAQDQLYMTQAIALAERGRYTVDPNPMVGAIVVIHDRIIGQGWHQYAGQAHAEVLAVSAALAKLELKTDSTLTPLTSATLYVSLEPCSHHGRTPPCAELLIRHGFARVVIGCLDPNPEVAGQGMAMLKQAGIAVDVLDSPDATVLNRSFFYRCRTQQPYVQIKAGASLDGRTALANGVSQWITASPARQDVHRLRLAASAIMTGSETILRDQAKLTARPDMLGFLPERQPLRVVLDSTLRCLDLLCQQAIQTPEQQTLLCYASGSISAPLGSRPSNLELIPMPSASAGLDLQAVLAELNRREMNHVLVEAGATLTGAMLQANLVDELIIYLAPTLLGPQARALFDLPLLTALPDPLWEYAAVDPIGSDLKLTLRPKVTL